jgi:hypothetical protein
LLRRNSPVWGVYEFRHRDRSKEGPSPYPSPASGGGDCHNRRSAFARHHAFPTLMINSPDGATVHTSF